MWTLLLSFHLPFHVEFLHNAWQQSELDWNTIQSKAFDWYYTVDWTFIICKITVDMAAVWQFLSVCLHLRYEHCFSLYVILFLIITFQTPLRTAAISKCRQHTLTLCYWFGHAMKSIKEHYETDCFLHWEFIHYFWFHCNCLPLAIFWHPWWYRTDRVFLLLHQGSDNSNKHDR